MKVNIRCEQTVTYDQEVEMSEKDFERLSQADFDVYACDDPDTYYLLENYINFDDVLCSSDFFECVSVEKIK